jgi:hypothetical protein
MAGPATKAPAPTKPQEYWKDATLALQRGSVDNKWAKAKKVTANVAHHYVSDMQRDLIVLGYLNSGSDDGSYGAGTERAVARFQHHAKRNFRMLNSAKISGTPAGANKAGVCNQSTALEIRSWISSGYRLPRGIHKLVSIDGGTLRDDAAKAWKEALEDVQKKGGMLTPPTGPKYSDTIRYPKTGFKSTGGNSKLSLHYAGRAVDLSMEPAGGKGQRWWIAKETSGSNVLWRIWCKTTLQDGTQGTEIKKQQQKYYEFWKNKGETWMPAGYYLDLTAVLASHKFERIKAQTGWESVAKKREWWHYFYNVDVQPTFLDEMELVGYTEQDLRRAGWSTADLDKPPG